MYTPTRCKMLSQTLESFQDINRTWHVLKTQGFTKLNPLILVPFAIEEEFALFYRKFFEAPGAAGFEACPLESAETVKWQDG